MRFLNHAAYALTLALLACGSASKPRVDTPETLPPAEPPADLSRAPAAAAADAGKPEGAGGEPGGR